MKIRAVLAALAGLLVLSTPAAADQGGFLPSSTSWISDRQGAVLGYTPCGGGNLCPKLLATTDGGRTWKPLNAPEVKLPDNHNQVKLTVVDARNAFVSDGTDLWATNDGARSWYSITLTSLRSPYYISKVAIAHGKVFAVGESLFNGDEDYTQIYAAPVGARTLQPVPGYVAKGGINYGDIAVDNGVVQVYLGANFADELYGYSTDGVHFTQAPLPCPVDMTGMLVGVAALTAWGLYRFHSLTANLNTPLPFGVPKEEFDRQTAVYKAKLFDALHVEYSEIFLITSLICLVGAVLALCVGRASARD
ncbi:WD40/YVTN/BNR-like repeat-containing protein [Kibdelosporangium lantanae]|uniref:WD40/YVTN/BNR-like repeat-containing protein n=1 Tax=Kibdelosporangium lantanae TaxID=1497396 RepID=A0ABW3M9Y7_9PSEU